ncbi:MAG: hypothetical protein JSS23_02375 [Proteobacteria bacterium]|nr:hypothetical protein [Pseudomonadota bacterium]
MKVLSVFILSIGLFGCANHPKRVAGLTVRISGMVSICELRASRSSFIGRTVRIRGIFESDGMTFSYLRDQDCGAESNTIRVSSLGISSGDASVAEFIARKRDVCAQTDRGYCAGGFLMDVLGVVTENRDGFLQIDLLHVYQADI